jgi:hypothetical protein
MKTKLREGAQEAKKASRRATLGKWHDMNRKQRREMMRKIQSEDLSLAGRGTQHVFHSSGEAFVEKSCAVFCCSLIRGEVVIEAKPDFLLAILAHAHSEWESSAANVPFQSPFCTDALKDSIYPPVRKRSR